MTRLFAGRPVVPGDISGASVVAKEGYSPLVSINDNQVAGKILCTPVTIGSTTGGVIIQYLAEKNKGPKAILFSRHIDTLAASAVVLSDIWSNKKIVTVDMLGDEFMDYVKDGMSISIKKDGVVEVD